MQSKRTKALAISQEVKKRVYERDKGRCVVCGAQGNPDAHYISRAHGGLGIEQNIVTLCRRCHHNYDQTINREGYGVIIAAYLRSQYPDWDPVDLIYKKQESY